MQAARKYGAFPHLRCCSGAVIRARHTKPVKLTSSPIGRFALNSGADLLVHLHDGIVYTEDDYNTGNLLQDQIVVPMPAIWTDSSKVGRLAW